MRAARIVGPRRAVIESAPVPVPGPKQIRFRVEGSGVCASNLGPWCESPWTQYPLGPGVGGHEAWGVVDALGSEVTGVALGQRIAAISYASFAEYDVVPEDAILPLPDSLSGQPFPGEALGCAFNIFRRARVEKGQLVAVIGVGFLGSLLVRLASQAGAQVIAISRRRSSLELASRMGASHLVELDDHTRVLEEVRRITDGRYCDRVIEATGKQWPLDVGGEITATRGTLVIAGYHQDGPRQVNLQLWNWRGIDVINAHERELDVYLRGMQSALHAILERRVDPTPLYTHRFKLEELGEALETTRERPGDFVKAVIVP